MKTPVLLIVDLPHVDEDRLQQLDREMSARRWSRAPRQAGFRRSSAGEGTGTSSQLRDTRHPGERRVSFCAEILGDLTDGEMTDAAEEDLTRSAESAGIYDWEAVCLFSGSMRDADPAH